MVFRSAAAAGLLALKGISALALAYTLSVAGRELIGFGLFSFVFLMISIAWAFWLFVRGMGYKGLLAVVCSFAALFFALSLYAGLYL